MWLKPAGHFQSAGAAWWYHSAFLLVHSSCFLLPTGPRSFMCKHNLCLFSSPLAQAHGGGINHIRGAVDSVLAWRLTPVEAKKQSTPSSVSVQCVLATVASIATHIALTSPSIDSAYSRTVPIMGVISNYAPIPLHAVHPQQRAIKVSQNKTERKEIQASSMLEREKKILIESSKESKYGLLRV